MKYPVEQKEIDVLWYNTDGRCFQLDIEDEQLKVTGVGSGLSDQWLYETIPIALSCVVLVHLSMNNIPNFFGQTLLPRMAWLIVVGFLAQAVFGLIFKLKYSVNFNFNRTENLIEVAGKPFVAMSEVCSLTAWQKGQRRFLLRLDFKNGKSLPIGLWRFSTKEFSWREDAGKIARFLNVPLHIPDVYEV